MNNNIIVHAKIHPAIGIARIGNSEEEYFLAPEVPYHIPDPEGGYKDTTSAIKRQAVKFRIYGYDTFGNVVTELNSDNAEIEWTVHIANKKAAWYNFIVALDIPEATDVISTTSTSLRNRDIRGEERKSLIIDPGPLSIKGKNQKGPKFDRGTFQGVNIYLGELKTDEKGNLIFLGGKGDAGSPRNIPLTTFANNDGWYDDTSDGPVRAKITIEGKEISVDPAWVVVGPPNYAPNIVTVQTMYDVVYEASENPDILYHKKPSFQNDILPLFRQFTDSSWVNFGFHIQFGWGAPYDFLNPEFIKKLCKFTDRDDPYQELRRQIFNMFRRPDDVLLQVNAWPPIYGDAYGDVDSSPRARLSITNTLLRYLQKWVDKDFYPDYDADEKFPISLEEIPIQDRPSILDRSALHYCMGGPFHPGCEMTWPMRHSSMYSAPLRLRHRTHNPTESIIDEEIKLQEKYGTILKPSIVLKPDGPLYASSPGDITKWMAVPWHTDTASCRSGYEADYDPYIPTFWPSRVPNHVLSEEEYNRVIDDSLELDERLKAFNTRRTWIRWLEGNYIEQITQMVKDFGKFGIIKKRDGIIDDLHFPKPMFVESEISFHEEGLTAEKIKNITNNLTFDEGRRVRFLRPRQLQQQQNE